MAKILVLYYSMYGHIETMAKAVAEGARSVEGTEVTIKRVPELMPEDVARRAGAKLDQAAPIASIDELPGYDAIISAANPFRQHVRADAQFSGPDRQLVGQRQSDWQGGQCFHLDRHPARRTGNYDHFFSFDASASGHDHRGRSLFLSGTHEHERNHGRIALWRGNACRPDGSRQPSENELKIARFQGAHVAKIARKLSA